VRSSSPTAPAVAPSARSAIRWNVGIGSRREAPE
jgi:hypothetical protein